MRTRYDPQLINDAFGDPGLYVDLKFERRALLFDLGDVSSLPPRKLVRISDAFVSHRHMDHFVGFDQLLRFLLGRDKVVRLYGPTGLIDAVEHKLRAYTWNLVTGQTGNLGLQVTELAGDTTLASACFSACSGFERQDAATSAIIDDVLLQESGLKVRAITLDHAIPVLAFALEERAHINIWRNRLADLGLVVGPWLRDFKDAIVRCEPHDTPVQVAWAETACRPQTLPLGELKERIMHITSGRKIAYVVDVAFTEANLAKIIALIQNADILFIEAAFLQADAAEAAIRHHLTAHQAGTIARLANVKRLATLHHSPRYRGQGDRLAHEAECAFRGE